MSSSEVTKQAPGAHDARLDVGAARDAYSRRRRPARLFRRATPPRRQRRSRDLADALGLEAWRTKVWCQAAAAVGILRAESAERFGFAPHMDALVDDASPELLTATFFPACRATFRRIPMRSTGALKTFHDHDEDFFAAQAKVSGFASARRGGCGTRPGRHGGATGRRRRVLDVGSGSGHRRPTLRPGVPGLPRDRCRTAAVFRRYLAPIDPRGRAGRTRRRAGVGRDGVALRRRVRSHHAGAGVPRTARRPKGRHPARLPARPQAGRRAADHRPLRAGNRRGRARPGASR